MKCISTHSCSIDLQFLFEIIDGDGGRPGKIIYTTGEDGYQYFSPG